MKAPTDKKTSSGSGWLNHVLRKPYTTRFGRFLDALYRPINQINKITKSPYKSHLGAAEISGNHWMVTDKKQPNLWAVAHKDGVPVKLTVYDACGSASLDLDPETAKLLARSINPSGQKPSTARRLAPEMVLDDL